MPAPKRRRWFSLSLRTLLIGMTVISMLFAWFLHHRREKIAEKERLEEQFAGREVHLRFEDTLLGWTLPERPVLGGCGLSEPYYPDEEHPWDWLRAISSPELYWASIQPREGRLSDDETATARRCRRVALYGQVGSEQIQACLSPKTQVLHYWLDPFHPDSNASIEDVPWISHCGSLHELSIGGHHTTRVMEQILSLPNLIDTNFESTAKELSSIRPPSGPLALTSLQIDVQPGQSVSISDATYRWLKRCTNLQQLTLLNVIDPRLLHVLSECPKLTRLRLDWPSNSLDDVESRRAAMQELVAWKDLRRLDLNCFGLDPASLATVARCSQLEELSIDGDSATVSPDALRALVQLKGLKRLSLHRCQLSDDHVAVLAAITSLQELSVHDHTFTAAGQEKLEKLPNLTTVSIYTPPDYGSEDPFGGGGVP